jgi:hypothetical protein
LEEGKIDYYQFSRKKEKKELYGVKIFFPVGTGALYGKPPLWGEGVGKSGGKV